MGALSITVGGVDVTANVELETVKVTNNIAVTADTCEFEIFIPDQQIAMPLGADELIIEDQTGRQFGGVVSMLTETQGGSEGDSLINELVYDVTGRDYSYHLARSQAVWDYPANWGSYGGIVKDLIARYGTQYGITANNVQNSFANEYQQFNWLPVDQAITLLANKISWQWYVDYYKDTWFFQAATNVSPLTGNTLNVDSDTTLYDPFWGHLGIYGDLKISEDVSQVKNRVFVRGMVVTASETLTDNFAGDGSTKSFPASYPPSHNLLNLFCTVGGLDYAVQADIVSGLPSATVQDFVCYVNWSTQTIRFNVAPGSGVAVVFTFHPQFPEIVTVDDPVDQRTMAARTGDTGIFEFSISDPTLSAEDTSPARARGQFEIAKYGYPHVSGQFTSWLPGWRSGQYFTLISSKRFGGRFAAPGQTFYVVKVEKQLRSNPDVMGGYPLWLSTVYFSDNVWAF